MASSYGFDVKDKEAAENWKAKAKNLNERAYQAVTEAAQILKDFQNMAEGRVFNEVCDYGDNVISGMKSVIEGMNEIINAVTKFIATIIAAITELAFGVQNKSRQTI